MDWKEFIKITAKSLGAGIIPGLIWAVLYWISQAIQRPGLTAILLIVAIVQHLILYGYFANMFWGWK